MLLNQNEQKLVAEAIAKAEKHTDAELVAVLAPRADNYYYIPLLWAALLALALPLALLWLPAWLTSVDIVLIQLLTFIVLSLLFRIPAIMMRLVPSSVKRWRAANFARRQFLENNLHHTVGETGVLIFVCEAEHYVEIIADRGISKHVSDAQWQDIVSHFVVQVKARRSLKGFVDSVEACGTLLAQHAPATRQKNELPNHLIIL